MIVKYFKGIGNVEYYPEEFSNHIIRLGDSYIEAQQTLKEFNLIVSKHNGRCILTSGTLLGAIRDGRLIEWDDDIDLITVDERQFLSSIKELIQSGFKLVSVTKFTETYSFIKNSIKIDVAIAKKIKLGNKFKYRVIWEICNEDLVTPKEFLFLNDKFYVPCNYLDLIEKLYGRDWKVPKEGCFSTYYEPKKIVLFIVRCKNKIMGLVKR